MSSCQRTSPWGRPLSPDLPLPQPRQRRLQEETQGHRRVRGALVFQQDADQQFRFLLRSLLHPAVRDLEDQVRLAPPPVLQHELARLCPAPRELQSRRHRGAGRPKEVSQVLHTPQETPHQPVHEVAWKFTRRAHDCPPG
jgi:hypothetical protein